MPNAGGIPKGSCAAAAAAPCPEGTAPPPPLLPPAAPGTLRGGHAASIRYAVDADPDGDGVPCLPLGAAASPRSIRSCAPTP